MDRRQEEHPYFKKPGNHLNLRNIHNRHRSRSIHSASLHIHPDERDSPYHSPQCTDFFHSAFSSLSTASDRSHLHPFRQFPAVLCSNGRDSIHISLAGLILAFRRKRRSQRVACHEKDLVVSSIVDLMPTDDRSPCIHLFQFTARTFPAYQSDSSSYHQPSDTGFIDCPLSGYGRNMSGIAGQNHRNAGYSTFQIPRNHFPYVGADSRTNPSEHHVRKTPPSS